MVAGIEASLAGGGFNVTRDSVGGRQAVIARNRRLFVLVAVFKAGMTGPEHLDRFLDEAGQYAATVAHGRAAAATAVAVAVVEAAPGVGGASAVASATAWATGWAAAPPSRPAAGRALGFPVLVDLRTGRVACPESPVTLRDFVGAHVRGPGLAIG